MTRTHAEVTMCLGLADQGLTATQISRRVDIPRSTVREWLHGRVPHARPDLKAACAACGHSRHIPEELPSSYVYLLGVYLGDGCISRHPRGVFRLRVFLDEHYPDIVKEVERAIRAVRPQNVVGQLANPGNYFGRGGRSGSCVEIYAYSKSWPCLFPQHGPGKKHLRRIALENWQWPLVEDHPELFLRGLIHSDGCRFMNSGRGGWRHPRYSFSNRSSDIRWLFCNACDLLDVHWTWSKNTIYVSTKDGVARLDEFIGPKA